MSKTNSYPLLAPWRRHHLAAARQAAAIATDSLLFVAGLVAHRQTTRPSLTFPKFHHCFNTRSLASGSLTNLPSHSTLFPLPPPSSPLNFGSPTGITIGNHGDVGGIDLLPLSSPPSLLLDSLSSSSSLEILLKPRIDGDDRFGSSGDGLARMRTD